MARESQKMGKKNKKEKLVNNGLGKVKKKKNV